MTPSSGRYGVLPAWTRLRHYKPRGFVASTACWLHVAWALVCVTQVAWGAPAPFYMGADIALETFVQQQNIVFADNRGQAPLDTLMYDHGANLFRLRVFVNPPTTYDNTNVGAIQTTAYDIALAQQIKAHAPNAKIVLDFHYSDTWADPGKQFKPQNLGGGIPASDWRSQDLPTLNTTVHDYTRDTLTAFQNAGVMPDIVQLGNETTGGMLWQTGASGGAAAGGRILFTGNTYPGLGLTNNRPTAAQTNQSWNDFGGLLNSAIAGVREVQGAGPRIPVALSIDKGDRSGQPQSFYGNIQSPALGGVTDFDIQGVDFYSSSNSGITTMQSNLTTLANTNYASFLADSAANPDTHLPLKKIMLLENNYPMGSGSTGYTGTWAKTPAGQQAELQAVRDLMYNLPHDDGEGVLWWFPEAVVPGPGSNYQSGSTALFDSTTGSSIHNALPALSVFETTLVPGDVDHDGQITLSDYAVLRDNFGTGPNARSFHGDLNHDGVVDLADFMLWKDLYVAAGGAGAGATGPGIPEPASAVLILMATPLLIGLAEMRLQRKRNVT